MPIPPLAVGHAISGNLVPVAGILFLGWSAPNILILYFVDTVLAMAVMFAGLMRHFVHPEGEMGWAARAKAEVGYVAGGLFLAAFIAVPLGIPLLFMLGGEVGWREILADPAFRGGLVMQAITALWSGRSLYQALRTRTPDELRIKRRFALVFLRWIVLVMVAFLGLGFLLGRYAALFFVVIYCATSILIEVAPDHFLRVMPGGAEDADRVRDQAAEDRDQKRRRARRRRGERR